MTPPLGCSDKKDSEATAARLKGNRFYKAKRWEKALELYMTSLKARPYAVNTLANVAQVRRMLTFPAIRGQERKRSRLLYGGRENSFLREDVVVRRSLFLQNSNDRNVSNHTIVRFVADSTR